ncbi:MAG TPA: glycosyltransferase family 2 protein [Candidatus Omnitrophota bacterium]|nr:glycosyltransferase family 2 protein [Candidatus Omnitrophota bacterium]
MAGRLSVVIITKNEESNIRDCIQSVIWADEIIVVDSGSSDRTVDICREFTDKVFSKEMRGFGAQKQFGVEKASCEWVLVLDADERVSPELGERLRKILTEGSGLDGYKIWRKTFYLGRWIRHCGWYAPVVRFFKKGRGVYDMRYVHESIEISGLIGEIREPILHFSYTSIDQHVNKVMTYSNYDALILYEKGVRITPFNQMWYLTAKPLLIFVRKYLFMKGSMDGTRGFLISAFTAFVVFLNYAKLWELQINRDRERSLPNTAKADKCI